MVTDLDGLPSAVLLRALELNRLPPWIPPELSKKPARLAAGPGKLCRALQIDLSLTAQPLQPGFPLWLEHRSPEFLAGVDRGSQPIVQTTRIGLTQGVDLPWRWYLAHSAAVSKR